MSSAAGREMMIAAFLLDPQAFVERLIDRRLARGEKNYGTSRSASPPATHSKKWLRENWQRIPGARKIAGHVVVSVADFDAWATSSPTIRKPKKRAGEWSPTSAIAEARGER